MDFNLNDIETIEADEYATSEDYFAAMQRAINSGMWSLQGSYGREMMSAIENGLCLLGEHGARDYWGNYIPSRYEVKAGTKGSADFVLEHQGQEWLDLMLAA
jgi:hypothetical protein